MTAAASRKPTDDPSSKPWREVAMANLSDRSELVDCAARIESMRRLAALPAIAFDTRKPIPGLALTTTAIAIEGDRRRPDRAVVRADPNTGESLVVMAWDKPSRRRTAGTECALLGSPEHAHCTLIEPPRQTGPRPDLDKRDEAWLDHLATLVRAKHAMIGHLPEHDRSDPDAAPLDELMRALSHAIHNSELDLSPDGTRNQLRVSITPPSPYVEGRIEIVLLKPNALSFGEGTARTYDARHLIDPNLVDLSLDALPTTFNVSTHSNLAVIRLSTAWTRSFAVRPDDRDPMARMRSMRRHPIDRDDLGHAQGMRPQP
jgi:hypothetical protein